MRLVCSSVSRPAARGSPWLGRCRPTHTRRLYTSYLTHPGLCFHSCTKSAPGCLPRSRSLCRGRSVLVLKRRLSYPALALSRGVGKEDDYIASGLVPLGSVVGRLVHKPTLSTSLLASRYETYAKSRPGSWPKTFWGGGIIII